MFKIRKTFITSDPHFGHSNIIEYAQRPFKDKYEMDKTIIDNWNKFLKKEYLVYVLGDISFYGKDKTNEIIKNLNGYKVLIMGNHDRRKSITYWKNVGFDEVSKHPILVEDKYLLSHEPRYELAGKGLYYNIHGHIHHLDINSDDKDIYFNVCVEKNNYKPWDFEVIKKRLEVKN